jgi:hypothetical protein
MVFHDSTCDTDNTFCSKQSTVDVVRLARSLSKRESLPPHSWVCPIKLQQKTNTWTEHSPTTIPERTIHCDDAESCHLVPLLLAKTHKTESFHPYAASTRAISTFAIDPETLRFLVSLNTHHNVFVWFALVCFAWFAPKTNRISLIIYKKLTSSSMVLVAPQSRF